MAGQRLERFDKSQRVVPRLRPGGVQRQDRPQRERRAVRQDAPRALPLADGVEQIQRQNPQNRRERHDSENPYVGEQPEARAAQRERPRRIPPKRPMNQVQRDHEHAQERQVLAVDE